jgi:hypothetical protein
MVCLDGSRKSEDQARNIASHCSLKTGGRMGSPPRIWFIRTFGERGDTFHNRMSNHQWKAIAPSPVLEHEGVEGLYSLK